MQKNCSSYLAAALLACVAPLAVHASEADLSPPQNGGSGQMPSGYSQLNFYVGDGYWAPELRLPQQPSAGDQVMLDMTATFGSRLELQGTAFASAGSVALANPQTHYFIWNEGANVWDVRDGAVARTLMGPNRPMDSVPASNHLMTQYTMENGRHAGRLQLPVWAPDNALLTVANRADWATTIVADGLSQSQRQCKRGQDCTFLFDGVRQRWLRQESGSVMQPMEQLPFPKASTVNVVTRVVDAGPLQMTLPNIAIHGDVYAFLHTHDMDVYSVSAAHTDMANTLELPAGKEVRFRFNRPMTRWEKLD
ncbi:hypothetical protein [[Pseudomonas] boreopolis]|uniref:hypothetical protein n=1 Tax=Xanthomonas boreopolis TaxID=86183 RepID=UPI003DA06625